MFEISLLHNTKLPIPKPLQLLMLVKHALQAFLPGFPTHIFRSHGELREIRQNGGIGAFDINLEELRTTKTLHQLLQTQGRNMHRLSMGQSVRFGITAHPAQIHAAPFAALRMGVKKQLLGFSTLGGTDQCSMHKGELPGSQCCGKALSPRSNQLSAGIHSHNPLAHGQVIARVFTPVKPEIKHQVPLARRRLTNRCHTAPALPHRWTPTGHVTAP